jgi:REP element-mobilizing transposase RayT
MTIPLTRYLYIGILSRMNTLAPPFYARNMKFSFQLHYHLGFRTRRRVPVFRNPRRLECLRRTLSDICKRNEYHVLECELDDYWVRLLLSLRPEHAPATVARIIKGNSSRLVFES